MNNEHEHIYDDCIGNPPFAEAMKTLGGVNTELILTEGQRGFFDAKKRILDEITPATETETKLKTIASFLLNRLKELQIASNKREAERTAAMERTAAVERTKPRSDFSKAWGVLVACYRAIDHNFGDEIRAHIEKNDRTQKEGQMRTLMEQMKKLTK